MGCRWVDEGLRLEEGHLVYAFLVLDRVSAYVPVPAVAVALVLVHVRVHVRVPRSMLHPLPVFS